MTKQVRKTISLTSATNSKLIALAAKFEGNTSMLIRKLIEAAWNAQVANETNETVKEIYSRRS